MGIGRRYIQIIPLHAKFMLKKIAYVLVIIGALNWGLIGFFGQNLVTAVFGGASSMTSLSSIVYDLIGLSGLYMLFKNKM